MQNSLLVELWKRPGLTPRDRGIVTLGGDFARSACARAYLLKISYENEKSRHSLVSPLRRICDPRICRCVQVSYRTRPLIWLPARFLKQCDSTEHLAH